MKKTIIHIGLHKTASTFLQENVWPEAKGYVYLSRPYTQHNHAFNQMQYADESLYRKERVLGEIDRMAADKLLLSDEAFSGKPIFFSNVNRSLIARRLQDLFPEAEIVLFIRDQKDIMLSHYSSYIKMPYGTKTIEHLFYRPQTDYSYEAYRKDPNRYDMESLYYNTNDYFIHFDCFLYSSLVDLFSRLFPKCHVFLYEEFQRDNQAEISRLEEILGQRIQVKSSERKNVSLSFEELEERRRTNMISSAIPNKSWRKVARLATRVAASIPDKDLSKAVAELVGNYYSEDNRALKERLPSLDWHRYPDKYT